MRPDNEIFMMGTRWQCTIRRPARRIFIRWERKWSTIRWSRTWCIFTGVFSLISVRRPGTWIFVTAVSEWHYLHIRWQSDGTTVTGPRCWSIVFAARGETSGAEPSSWGCRGVHPVCWDLRWADTHHSVGGGQTGWSKNNKLVNQWVNL